MDINEILMDIMPKTPDRFNSMITDTVYECTHKKLIRKKSPVKYRKPFRMLKFGYGFAVGIVLLIGGGVVLAYSVPKLKEYMATYGLINENTSYPTEDVVQSITNDTDISLKVDEVYLDGMILCFTMHSDDESLKINGIGDHIIINGFDRALERFDTSANKEYFVSVALNMNIYDGHEGEKPLTFKPGDEVNVQMKLYIDGMEEKVPYSFKSVIDNAYSGYAEIPDQNINLKNGITASVHDSFISDSITTLNISFDGMNTSNIDIYETYIADNSDDFWIEYFVENDKGDRCLLPFNGTLGNEWNINITGIGRDTAFIKLIPCRYTVNKDSGKPDYSNPEMLEDYSFVIKLK